MEIDKYIKNNFPKVNIYDGVKTVEGKLLDYGYLVVFDEDNKFYGILSPVDLVRRPHLIVADCVTDKEVISYDDCSFDIMRKFSYCNSSALPVFNNKEFIGIIERSDVLSGLESKVDELHKKSLISDEAKNNFLRNISHEVRTPLNGILGFLEMIQNLKATKEEKDTKRFIQIMRSSADRFLLVMNDLIELSLIDAGEKPNLTIDKILVKQIFDEVIMMFNSKSDIANNKVDINYDISDKVRYIYTDAKRLKHLLYHLIENAVKFSASKYISIFYQTATDTDKVSFIIRNNTNDNFDFEMLHPFQKQDLNNDEFNPGLGIGLPVVKKLTTILEGNLNIKHLDMEMEVTVTIPVRHSQF
ncbi:histidine kinase dimerization/phospho-acceptor domain-containing protein [Marinilabiliaceae bacterium ANBcel2]|nr:histidine kinase dimerization/phospho-acceptor domain-containing protein [Marinilabiliaceae bacterium ANBcel2]